MITRFPRPAAISARHLETVVLPTPPLPVTKTSRLSRRKAIYPSEYSTPYGSVRTKEFQYAGVSAVTLVRDQRARGRKYALGGVRNAIRSQGASDLVRQPEGGRREDDDDP